VLDQAKAENLSDTATMERLFGIEVPATQARRLTGRLRFASLPSPTTLEDFDYAQPGVDPALIRDLASNRYLDTATNTCSSGRPESAKQRSPSASPAGAPKPATAPTSPTPPTSPPVSPRRHRTPVWPPPCGSTPDPPAWSSTSSATSRYPPKPHPPTSRSSINAI
jgi:hypothetical protein